MRRESEPERRLEGQQFTKLGRKYQHDLLYLQSINFDKHLPQSPFPGQYFYFALVSVQLISPRFRPTTYPRVASSYFKTKKTCVQLFHYGAKEKVYDCTSPPPPPPPPTPSSPLNEAIKCLVLLCQAGRAVMHSTLYTLHLILV